MAVVTAGLLGSTASPALAQGFVTSTTPAQQTVADATPANGSNTTSVAKKSATAKGKDDGQPKVSDKKPVTPNATASIVNVLVEKGIITEDQAAEIVKQADDESYVSREAAKDATEKAADAAKAAKDAALAASPPGTKRVSYVPEVVRRQLRDEIKQEVMSQAQRENWASPGKYPEWASRIRISGDIRARYEGIMYPSGNATGDYFPNFNAINTGNPVDISDIGQKNNPYPNYNTDQDRDRFRLRMRLGIDADLSEGWAAGIRVATGDSGTPVSTNQTFGGNGGNFSKYSIWLDRAFLKYQPGQNLDLTVGRFNNPFFSPTELVWDRDLGFDGAAFRVKHRISENLQAFAVGGAFPIFNTNLDFAANEINKFKSDDKYLYGAQLGLAWKARPEVGVKVAAAYFDFDGVKGHESTPCNVYNTSTACDTDADRPSYAQRGNTYTPLRNIIRDSTNDFGKSNQYQYFGLASDFQTLVISGQLDLAHFNPIHIIVDGEYLQNLAFKKNNVAGRAVNNIGPTQAGGGGPNLGPYEGGNIGWLIRTTVGHKELDQYGDWNANVGYKYLESDATVDAFADSDFGLGGTNLKGYFVGGNYALSQNVSTSLTWMSANAIAGAPFAVDVLQLDLNAKF